jgi:hypothetical protein
MKTYLKTAIAVVAIMMTMTGAHAQTKLDEGSIVFELTLTDNDLDPQVASMMPKEMTMVFKGDKSKTEMKMSIGTFTIIYDAKAKTLSTLMDMMGQKMVMKLTEEDMEKQKGKEKKTTIKYLDDTKMICGFNCHKAEVTVEGEKDKQIVYYTKDIVAKNANAMKGGLKGIDGFPMEYVMDMQGIGTKMTAKSINKDKIDESVFKIPAEYKEMSADDMKKMGH